MSRSDSTGSASSSSSAAAAVENNGRGRRRSSVLETLAAYLSTVAVSSPYLDIDLPSLSETHTDEPFSPPTPPLRPSDHHCPSCGHALSRRPSMSSSNATLPRIYHSCTNPSCPKHVLHQRDFVTFQAHGDNPVCDCALPAKQKVVEEGSLIGRPGYGYWCCKEGRCRYVSADRKGRSVMNGEVEVGDVKAFLPWLLDGK